MRAKNLAGPDREELLADVDAQLKELSTLVGDLVDLARDDERPQPEPVPVPFERGRRAGSGARPAPGHVRPLRRLAPTRRT